MSTETIIKSDLDLYLKELSKEYAKLTKRKMPAEIILVGGAAILTQYGFRNMTTDIDALFSAASAMKDAIRTIRDKYDLPNDWLNDDFKRTASYSDKLYLISEHYRTFSNTVNVRIVKGKYLVAMKLVAFRYYKHDLSDIVGILQAHRKASDEITFADIESAVVELYGSWEVVSPEAKEFLNEALRDDNLDKTYVSTVNDETTNKNALIDFEETYPDVLNEMNIDDILSALKASKN